METKIVYQTNELGYLIGTIELNAKEDQSRAGTWQIPAWCIEKKPPKEKEKCCLRWIEDKWINEPLPEPEEVPVPTLEEKIDNWKRELLIWYVTERSKHLEAFQLSLIEDNPEAQGWIKKSLQALKDDYFAKVIKADQGVSPYE